MIHSFAYPFLVLPSQHQRAGVSRTIRHRINNAVASRISAHSGNLRQPFPFTRLTIANLQTPSFARNKTPKPPPAIFAHHKQPNHQSSRYSPHSTPPVSHHILRHLNHSTTRTIPHVSPQTIADSRPIPPLFTPFRIDPSGFFFLPMYYKKAVSYTHLTLPTICSV